jgi:hypothetical protein
MLVDKSGAQLQAADIDTLIRSAIPLTLQAKLDKARMHSFELMSHLEGKAAKSEKSKDHYAVLMQEIGGVNQRLANMNPEDSPAALDKELGLIEGSIVPLTNQTPYTLLMMRVVEIGLPLLLSLFSIFFVIRYSLTEKRSHEIKDLLRQRSLQNTNG